MFARKNDNGNFDLFDDTGGRLTTFPDEWPMVWPVDSDVSAYHEHPEGITLPAEEYVKIAKLVPVNPNYPAGNGRTGNQMTDTKTEKCVVCRVNISTDSGCTGVCLSCCRKCNDPSCEIDGT